MRFASYVRPSRKRGAFQPDESASLLNFETDEPVSLWDLMFALLKMFLRGYVSHLEIPRLVLKMVARISGSNRLSRDLNFASSTARSPIPFPL
jgi:hypothetical protein